MFCLLGCRPWKACCLIKYGFTVLARPLPGGGGLVVNDLSGDEFFFQQDNVVTVMKSATMGDKSIAG